MAELADAIVSRKRRTFRISLLYWTVAQWLERNADNVEVEGSIPSRPTRKKKRDNMGKKKEEPKAAEAPLRVYIEYNEHRSGGEALDPGDRWTSHEDTNIEVSFVRLHRQQPKNRFFYDSIELPNPKMIEMGRLWLAVVRYGTGDTFGSTNGAWHIVGIAPTYQVAEAMLEEAIKPSKEGEYSSYKPWEGYFESLEGTEIHELRLV